MSLALPRPSTHLVAAQEHVRIEYVAHAAFVIESPGGTRIALDPYNGNIWLGYSYPEGIEADAVLVSHPHFDHDATYYFDDGTPVFRRPAVYRVGDVTLRGIAAEHVGRPRFLDRGQSPLNTIWVIETGGVRIAHLGDNRLPNEVDLEAVGEVDLLVVPAAHFEPANGDMLDMMLAETRPRVMVPMHYRHEPMSSLPRDLRTVDEYLGERAIERDDDNVFELTASEPDSSSPRIVVLHPSPDVEPWPASLEDAWVEAAEGAGLLADSETEADAARAEEALWEGLFHFETAMDLAPHVLAFGYGAADALARLGEVNDAIETLDHAVARAPRADWTDRLRAHMLLGELYERGGRPDIAVEHYAWVVAQRYTHETSLRERALARLAELR